MFRLQRGHLVAPIGICAPQVGQIFIVSPWSNCGMSDESTVPPFLADELRQIYTATLFSDGEASAWEAVAERAVEHLGAEVEWLRSELKATQAAVAILKYELGEERATAILDALGDSSAAM
jgi:hypothetical protein